MIPDVINLSDKLGRIDEAWSPRIVATLNDYEIKLAKLEGEFVWHAHADTDELFLCLDGELAIEFREGSVELKAGELVVVPRGVEHRPVAARPCQVALVEPAGVVNTGDADSELTAPTDRWI